MMSKELRRKLGEVEVVKTLRDGNLLIICRTEEQENKAMQIEIICKKREGSSMSRGEERCKRRNIRYTGR